LRKFQGARIGDVVGEEEEVVEEGKKPKKDTMKTPEKKVQEPKKKKTKKPKVSEETTEKKRSPEQKKKVVAKKKKENTEKRKPEKKKESTEKRKPEQKKEKKQKPAEGKKKRKKGKAASNKTSKKKVPQKTVSEKNKQVKKKPKKKASQPKAEGKKNEGGAKNSKTKQAKGGKGQKAQKSQKKSQSPQKKSKSKQKQTKKGKKKVNIRSKLLGICRKPKSEAQLISIFSETLVNDIRFKGKYSNKVEISLDLHGQRMYRTKKAAPKPAQKPKKAEAEKAVKKKKVNVRQEVLVLCRKTRSEDELIKKFGEKLVNEMRFKGKFSSRIELTVDQFGKRQYTTKKSAKAQRSIRKNQIRAAIRSLIDMGSAENFEVCQNAIRENFPDWSKADSTFTSKAYENEKFKKELKAPVVFKGVTTKALETEVIKQVLTLGSGCEFKRLSPTQCVVNFETKSAASKCIQKLNGVQVSGGTVKCQIYKPQ